MKQPPSGTEERIAKMTFESIYPLYLAKVREKGRSKEELDEVITWLTGYDEKQLMSLIKSDVTFETFFEECRRNPKASLIGGIICGYLVEDLGNRLFWQARYPDKLFDELAKERKMQVILRMDTGGDLFRIPVTMVRDTLLPRVVLGGVSEHEV